jgi:hypothetical protein
MVSLQCRTKSDPLGNLLDGHLDPFGPFSTAVSLGRNQSVALHVGANYKSMSDTAMGFASHLAIRAHDAALTPSAT